MKNKNEIVVIIICFWLISLSCTGNSVDLQIEYPDQALPGKSLSVFAQDLVSTENREHSSVTFSNDGTELFFTRQYK
ncbi:MAG: hypothetical protein GY863_23290, partial [bacterium]|nr:hypothetical protein [bacterium]